MRYRINNNVMLFTICLLSITSACNKAQENEQPLKVKSELVQRLEKIFYADNFTKIPSKVFNVQDYGAIGDSITLNTVAIQQAIDAATAAGGGKVIFPKGIYLSGALFLKSNVELYLDEGVVIRAIQDDKHFPDKWTRVAGIEMNWPAALINIYQQKNVRISGKGIIDGNGSYWWDKFWGTPARTGGMWVDYTKRNVRWALDYDCKRVRAVVVYDSENISLKDFTVLRSGFWTISLTYSNKVHVDGLVIKNNIGGFGPSSDGINTDSSSDILVENCDIDCNDDNLCIKAGRDSDGLRVNRPAENIVYRNCITRAGHGLFTIGSETSGGVRNVEVYGLEAFGTNTGIRFKSAKVRGGLIENIYFHDIKMKNVNKPFQFELNWYPKYSYPVIPDEFIKEGIPRHWKVMTTPVEPAEKGIPEFKNITLENIIVNGAERGFYANAYPEQAIHDLHWENVSIEAEEAGVLNYAKDWTMKNVVLKTHNNEALIMNHCANIEPPKQVVLFNQISSNSSINSQLKTLQTDDNFTGIVAVNPNTQSIILEKDTTTYSKKMEVYLLRDNTQSTNYFEPLGDGFYISPVNVNYTGSSLTINGEREHEWKFLIKTDLKPQKINGADSWEYNEDQKQLVIEKSGMQFELSIVR